MELKENTVIVVLGASGDLAKKKTVSTCASQLTCTKALLTTCTVPCSLRPGKPASSVSSC